MFGIICCFLFVLFVFENFQGSLWIKSQKSAFHFCSCCFFLSTLPQSPRKVLSLDCPYNFTIKKKMIAPLLTTTGVISCVVTQVANHFPMQ